MSQPHKASGVWHHPKWAGEWERARHNNWWGNSWMLPFGLISPLIGAAFSLAFTILSLWILKLANVAIQSQLASMIISAVSANIWVFFAFSLATGYLDFLSKRSVISFMALTPISSAGSITFSAWILAWLFRAIGGLASVQFLSDAGIVLRQNLIPVFVLFLALGYASILASRR